MENDNKNNELSNSPEVRNLWSQIGERLYLDEPFVQFQDIPNAIYKLEFDQARGRFYVKKIADKFVFDYKIYGLETSLVDRVVKTYKNTNHGNIGVLLNGLKGTGKTVSSKIMCNRLEQPVIVVSDGYKTCHNFLNSIPQNITIFIDEYEKVFGKATEMLTIMDGALNSEFRRVFILTTNHLSIDENLIQRPGRIRYLKKFKDLTPKIVAEIVDDVLIHKELREECITFISSLEVITVDIVKAVLQEVNLHNEAPEIFADVFNVRKLTGKYDISARNSQGIFVTVKANTQVSPRPSFDGDEIGNWFHCGDNYIGKVIDVKNFDTIVVRIEKGKKVPEWLKAHIKNGVIVFKVKHANMYNYSFKFGAEGMGGNLGGFANSEISDDYSEYDMEDWDDDDEDDNESDGAESVKDGEKVMLEGDMDSAVSAEMPSEVSSPVGGGILEAFSSNGTTNSGESSQSIH